MAPRTQLGYLLVDAGIISIKTLDRALEMQKGSGKRIGALLQEMGIVSEEEVVESLAKQCNLRTVRNFAGQNFPRELLSLVPAKLALEKTIFPLKQHQGMLAIATLDPFDNATFDYLAGKTGMKIYLALATRGDIFAAINKHYLNGKWKRGARQKVLLIDSSQIVVKLLEPALAQEGYDVFVEFDGVDGLKSAYTHHPDIIICDLMMPRMDGYTFLQALQAHPDTTDIPVILMSSKASTEEEHRALKAGFNDFIWKPAMPIRVLARIRKVFNYLEGSRRPSASTNSTHRRPGASL